MEDNQDIDTLDLSPDWEGVARYFERRCIDAISARDYDEGRAYLELAERARGEDLTKEELYTHL